MYFYISCINISCYLHCYLCVYYHFYVHNREQNLRWMDLCLVRVGNISTLLTSAKTIFYLMLIHLCTALSLVSLDLFEIIVYTEREM